MVGCGCVLRVTDNRTGSWLAPRRAHGRVRLCVAGDGQPHRIMANWAVRCAGEVRNGRVRLCVAGDGQPHRIMACAMARNGRVRLCVAGDGQPHRITACTEARKVGSDCVSRVTYNRTGSLANLGSSVVRERCAMVGSDCVLRVTDNRTGSWRAARRAHGWVRLCVAGDGQPHRIMANLGSFGFRHDGRFCRRAPGHT